MTRLSSSAPVLLAAALLAGCAGLAPPDTAPATAMPADWRHAGADPAAPPTALARWVRDGRIWTSAGVSAGIDLTLAFIADVAGEDAAGKVQFSAEYYPDGVRYGRCDQDAQAPRYLAPAP